LNKKNYLIERILSLDPVTDVIKAMKFSQILFSIEDNHPKEYKNELEILSNIENDVLKGLNLDLCFEIFYTYKNYNFKNVINHRTKNGSILKIPLYELRAAIRKVYFGVVEIIFKSDIMASNFEIGESGDTSYKNQAPCPPGDSFE